MNKANHDTENIENTFDELQLKVMMEQDWQAILQKINPDEETSTPRLTPIKWQTIAVRVAAVVIVALATGIIWNSQTVTIKVGQEVSIANEYVLPDGSSVLMFPGSELSHPKKMHQRNRKVNLSGEAIFDVTAEAGAPFLVISGGAYIKVTGTTFLVSAPKNSDQVEVLVEHGKVLFYNSEKLKEGAVRVGLTAGERGVYTASNQTLNKINEKSFYSIP